MGIRSHSKRSVASRRPGNGGILRAFSNQPEAVIGGWDHWFHIPSLAVDPSRCIEVARCMGVAACTAECLGKQGCKSRRTPRAPIGTQGWQASERNQRLATCTSMPASSLHPNSSRLGRYQCGRYGSLESTGESLSLGKLTTCPPTHSPPGSRHQIVGEWSVAVDGTLVLLSARTSDSLDHEFAFRGRWRSRFHSGDRRCKRMMAALPGTGSRALGQRYKGAA